MNSYCFQRLGAGKTVKLFIRTQLGAFITFEYPLLEEDVAKTGNRCSRRHRFYGTYLILHQNGSHHLNHINVMINYDLVSKSRVSIKEVFEQGTHGHRHRNVTATNVPI